LLLTLTVWFVYLSSHMLWLRLCEDCKSIPWFIIDAVRLCACSHGFESKPCCEICEAYGLCYVSNYLGRIPKGRCCTNYKVVVYRIGQTSPVPPVSHFLSPPSPVAPPFPRSLVPPFLVSPFPHSPFPHSPFRVLKIAGFSLFHVFQQRRRSFCLYSIYKH
jgi:hypothetical protein